MVQNMSFVNEVKELLQEKLGGGVEISVREVLKNNETLTGLTIKAESNIAPTIYLEEYEKSYNDGAAIGDIVEDLVGIYNSSKVDNFDLEAIKDWKKVSKYVFPKAICLKGNEKLVESLVSVPYVGAIVATFYINLTELGGMSNASIPVSKELLSLWGVTFEELFETAQKNQVSTYELIDMLEIMRQLMSKEMPEEMVNQMINEISVGPKQFVLTNFGRIFGGAMLLNTDVLKEVSQKLGESFYILPSSVHELILLTESDVLSGDGNPEEYLLNMVTSVNATGVKPQDKLTDEVYFFDMATGEVKVAISSYEKVA